MLPEPALSLCLLLTCGYMVACLRLLFLRLAAGKVDAPTTAVTIPVLLGNKHMGLEISTVHWFQCSICSCPPWAGR